MKDFELKFTAKNNVIRVTEKPGTKTNEGAYTQIAIHDIDEPGRPNAILMNKDQVRLFANHLLNLIGE